MSVNVEPIVPWLIFEDRVEETAAKAFDNAAELGKHTRLTKVEVSYPTTFDTKEGVTLKLPLLYTIIW